MSEQATGQSKSIAGFLQTPSQTVGPFFGYALPYERGAEVRAPWHQDSVRIHGTVVDGAGDPVPDAVLEIWGADASGLPSIERGALARDGHGFTGFGRTAVDRAGHFSFDTVRPGRSGDAAPFVLVVIFARGLLHHLFTRAYFDDHGAANRADPLLQRVDPARRATLIAVSDGDASYRFDIRLQGGDETVFLDLGGEG